MTFFQTAHESRFSKVSATLASLLTVSLSFGPAALANEVDKSIPKYAVAKSVSGTLKAIGSDTMNNELSMWGEGFQKLHPGVKVEVEGKGSSTAPTALIEGTAKLGPMSRLMKAEEVEKFKSKFGYEPTPVRTSMDVLAVYVHRDNPLKGLSLEQIDGIFSKTFKSGSKDLKTWGDLGLKGEWADKPIKLYGRNSASGTYGYFKEHALKNGDFKDTVKEQPGSSSVVQSVAEDKYGVGYSGIGASIPGARAVPVSSNGANFVVPDAKNAYEGSYPLSRFLVIYINKSPTVELDPLTQEFLSYVLSQDGQETVLKNGYIPLTPAIISAELKKLGSSKKM